MLKVLLLLIILSLQHYYILFSYQNHHTLVFDTPFSNSYRYLKVVAKATKNSKYGTVHLARYGIMPSINVTEGEPRNMIKNQDIISYITGKLDNVSSYTTYTLDLSNVSNTSYYIYLHNCDTTFYIQKIWLTNTA